MSRLFTNPGVISMSLLATMSACGDMGSTDPADDRGLQLPPPPVEQPITGVPVCEQNETDGCLPGAAFQFVYVDWVGSHSAVRLGRVDGTASQPILDFHAGVATVPHVHVSPRGDRMVYIDWNDADYEGWSLYTRELLGGEPRELLRMAGGYNWGLPRLSPQGDAVVFVDWRSGGWAVELVRLPSGELETLETSTGWTPAFHVAPSFAPDGRGVLFANAANEVVSIDIDTGERSVLYRGGDSIVAPVFAPNGQEIAFTEWVGHDWVLSTVPAQGADVTRRVWTSSGGYGPMSYSPDSSRVGLVDFEHNVGAVVRVIDIATAEVISHVALTAGLIDFAPTWSPDGSTLLTTAFEQPFGGGTVRWLDTDSGESNDVLWLGTGISGGHPQWLAAMSNPL